MKFLIPSWEDIYDMCICLADTIKESKFKPDLIVAVARGGWIPGRIMSDLLSNSNIASLRVEFYKDVAKTSGKPIISQKVSASVRDKRILVVDDVADTGESLRVVRDYLKKLGPTEIRIATLHYKPKSIVKPDYFIGETDAWIVYPHERHEFVKNMVRRLRKDGMSFEDAGKEIKETGLDPKIVDMFIDEVWPKA